MEKAKSGFRFSGSAFPSAFTQRVAFKGWNFHM